MRVKMKHLIARGVYQIALNLIVLLSMVCPECPNQESFPSGPEDGRHGFKWGPDGKTI